MKKLISVFVVVSAFFGLLAIPALASKPDPVYKYNFMTIDNGMQGHWAIDHFRSEITITESDDDCYDVVREDSGTFEVIDNALSPGGENDTTVGNGTIGEISGGATLHVCGTLISNPEKSPNEQDLTEVTTTNYVEKYFSRYFEDGATYHFTDWGWTYSTCNNGTWVDTHEMESLYSNIGSNSEMGDITGDYVPCHGNKQKATGGVSWLASFERHLEFNAHEEFNNQPAKGMARYWDEQGNTFDVDVEGVMVNGDEACFWGKTMNSVGAYSSQNGKTRYWYVVDGGEPQADEIGGLWLSGNNHEANCAKVHNTNLHDVVTGNLQVHNN